jgi:hypothetical protein
MHARTCTTMVWSHVTMFADLSSPPHLNPVLGDARRSISPPTPMPSCISHLSHSTGTLASLSYTVARLSLSSFVLLNALALPSNPAYLPHSVSPAQGASSYLYLSVYLTRVAMECYSYCFNASAFALRVSRESQTNFSEKRTVCVSTVKKT